MKKQLIIIGITLVLITVGLSGCDEKDYKKASLQVFDSRFLGDWETDILDSKVWSFDDTGEHIVQSSDGTMHSAGSWRSNDDTIDLFNYTVSYTYEFSVKDDVLTLSAYGDSLEHPTFIVLIRPVRNPSADFTGDSATNKITVTNITDGLTWGGVTVKLKWKDIRISYSSGILDATYQVFNGWGIPIDAVNQTSGAGDTEIYSGDYVLVSHPTYTGNVEVMFTHISGNRVLDIVTIEI